MTSLNRRQILPASALTIVPGYVSGRGGFRAPGERFAIAAVGIGGVCRGYLEGCESENIVALADVDEVLAAPIRAKYPAAKFYHDYRRMLEREKGIDAVIVATPDHSHAVIAMAALQAGKHVYVAKPMTRTIAECHALRHAAKERRLASQMSVQTCSADPAVTTEEWIKAGVVGKVGEVHVWNDRPVWPQALHRPQEHVKVPATLDWDLWLGPAAARPYHPVYHPFNFRGWYDFGTGALGDMACHTLHVIIKALDLGSPSSVEASATVQREALKPGDEPEPKWARSRKGQYPETFPASSIVSWEFPARGQQPAVRVIWYDGGLRPPRPEGMAKDRQMGPDGILFVGDKGTLWSGFTGGPKFLNKQQERDLAGPPKTLPRVQDHYREWIDACNGGPESSCNFEFAAPVTEVALLGVMAQRTGRLLEWDAEAMAVRNDPEANALVKPAYRAGWRL